MFKNTYLKLIIGISFLLILIMELTGCDTLKVSDGNTPQMLSVSCFEKNANISFYKLDVLSKQAELLKTLATPGNFTPNVLSDDGNLYYPKRDSSGKYVQLFKYNLVSKEEIQLTNKERDSIILVEFLHIDNLASKIFMRILRSNHQNSELASYNLKTEEIKLFGDLDEDAEVSNFDICKGKGLVVVAIYSKAEDLNNMEKANKSQQTLKPPQYNFTIYDEDGNKVKDCKPIKDFVSDISLSPDGSLLLISISTEWLNDNHGEKNIICTQNLETGEIKQILKSSDQFQEIENARFSADGKGFFYLATKPNAKSFVDDGNYMKVPNTIFYYDLQTNQSNEIWSADNKTITNYVVLDK